MISNQTRNLIKTIICQSSDGISLTHLHNRVQRLVTRLQLRGLVGNLYKKEEISRERITTNARRVTMYYPFNGKPPVIRIKKRIIERNKKMLSMKDFMPGRKYSAFIEP